LIAVGGQQVAGWFWQSAGTGGTAEHRTNCLSHSDAMAQQYAGTPATYVILDGECGRKAYASSCTCL